MLDARTVLDASVATAAAMLAAPVVALVPALPDAGAVPVGVAAGWAAIAYAGARSADSLPAMLDRKAALLALAPPVASGGWFVHLATARGVSRPAFAVGAAAALPVLAAVAAAHHIRLGVWADETTTLATFEARPAPRARRLLLVGTGTVVAGGLALVAAGAHLGASDPAAMGALTAPVAAVAAATTAASRERTVEIATAGVRIDRVVQDWDAFESYELTDEAISLRRGGLAGDRTFDRSDVEDVEAATAALDRFLPESSG